LFVCVCVCVWMYQEESTIDVVPMRVVVVVFPF
jgi:hypothetical protein